MTAYAFIQTQSIAIWQCRLGEAGKEALLNEANDDDFILKPGDYTK